MLASNSRICGVFQRGSRILLHFWYGSPSRACRRSDDLPIWLGCVYKRRLIRRNQRRAVNALKENEGAQPTPPHYRSSPIRLIYDRNRTGGPDGGPPHSPLIPNEQTKLTATYLNGIAIALFAVGGIAPTVALLNSDSSSPGIGTSAMAVVCLVTSTVLHLLARAVLRSLK